MGRRARRSLLGCLVIAGLFATGGHAAGPAHETTAQPAATSDARPGASRLRVIVSPARVRPGRLTNVRIADARRRGGLSATVCARSAARSTPCRSVRLRGGTAKTRVRVRLPRAGRWTIVVRAGSDERLVRRVDVSAKARYQVLVAGDSMAFGIIDVLGRSVRATGGTLRGDANAGTGITKPALVNWPLHAASSARRGRPDATVVFLGGAIDAFPVMTAAGASADCCGPLWVAEYERRVRAVMTAYLRNGHGLVYWVLLPAPRDLARVESIHAINAAITRAAGAFADGVTLVDIAPLISPGDRFVDAITYRGKRVVVRETDGMHLANAGVHIATNLILRAMRRDGIAQR